MSKEVENLAERKNVWIEFADKLNYLLTYLLTHFAVFISYKVFTGSTSTDIIYTKTIRRDFKFLDYK